MPVRDLSDVVNDPTVLELLTRMPALLYRYSGTSATRLEWMQKLIVESALYFAPPSAFNDPLDCRIPPTFDGSSLAIEHFWRTRFKQTDPQGNLRDHKKQIHQMVMDSKTEAGQRRLAEYVFKSLDQNGIACFAKDPANMLLWSYYAEGHRGIAVRFNMTREHLAAIGRLFMPIEVEYTNNFPIVNYYKATTHQLLRTILGTKSRAWKHEEEWRVVLPGKVGSVYLPPQMIDAVVLGMRTDPKTVALVREWLKGRIPTVKLLRVVHRPWSFILDIVPA